MAPSAHNLEIDILWDNYRFYNLLYSQLVSASPTAYADLEKEACAYHAKITNMSLHADYMLFFNQTNLVLCVSFLWNILPLLFVVCVLYFTLLSWLLIQSQFRYSISRSARPLLTGKVMNTCNDTTFSDWTMLTGTMKATKKILTDQILRTALSLLALIFIIQDVSKFGFQTFQVCLGSKLSAHTLFIK